MKRLARLALLGLGVLAGGAVLAWALAPRPLEVERVQATLGPFESSIDEDARTVLHDRYVVSAPLAGRLQRLSLREGDAVQPGSPVASLTPVLSPMLDQRSLQQQEARVGAAQAAVQRAQAQAAAQRAGRDRARLALQRSEQLALQGFVAATVLDADRLGALAAQRELDSALEGVHVAEHELGQARAALGLLQAGPGERTFVLRAPVAGQVLKVHQASETTVALGAPVLDLGDLRGLEVLAELLSVDALRVQPGQAVRIEGWGGRGALSGQVHSVSPAAFTKVSALGVEEQRVNVRIAFTGPVAERAGLGDGYRVAVRIITRHEAQVLRVPVSAVFPRPGAAVDPTGEQAAVFEWQQDRARLRLVTVAARNDQQAWVSAGLSAGTTLINYPPAALKDGARVRERRP